MSEENKTRDAVDAVAGLAKAIPVYQDVVQPAAKEIGVGLQKTVQLALSPISGLVWGFDKIKDFVGTSVAKRLEKIPEEQIITPLPQIAGPALEALKYTGHDENLREMFAKLLATAMDEKTATQAHPSFVEIIRQLSSDEAKLCRFLKGKGSLPIVNLNEQMEGDSFQNYIPHFSLMGYKASCKFPKLIQRYTDNLNRLGLVEIHFNATLTDKNQYLEIESHPDFLRLIRDMKESGKLPKIVRGITEVPIFGSVFLEACID